jgi:hypothetical protein
VIVLPVLHVAFSDDVKGASKKDVVGWVVNNMNLHIEHDSADFARDVEC